LLWGVTCFSRRRRTAVVSTMVVLVSALGVAPSVHATPTQGAKAGVNPFRTKERPQRWVPHDRLEYLADIVYAGTPAAPTPTQRFPFLDRVNDLQPWSAQHRFFNPGTQYRSAVAMELS
jgi:hypothetical protein